MVIAFCAYFVSGVLAFISGWLWDDRRAASICVGITASLFLGYFLLWLGGPT